MPRESEFQELAMPLAGPLDSRSRPSDLLPFWFRHKLNMAVNRSGKLSRRAGYGALSFGQRSDSTTAVNNWDHHRVGATRGPKTMLYDSTGPDGTHRLFDAQEDIVSVMDNDTSEWANIVTELGGGGTKWKAATLRDKVILTNNHDQVRFHVLGTATSALVTELSSVNGPNTPGTDTPETGIAVTKAKVVLEFNGVIVLMNTEEEGERFGTRVRWSDFNNATGFNPATPGTVTGFQDLPYGDEILNAVAFNGQIYIFTVSSIWRMFIQVGIESIFGFAPVYTEPKNRTGCLAYEDTLITTGKEIIWAGRDSLYLIDQYRSAPVSEEWMLKASGRMFEGDERIDPRCCSAAVAEYKPDTKEIWFSYPRLSSATDAAVTCLNDYTLVLVKNDELSVPIRTADYVDAGFTAFVNFARNIETGLVCKADPVFIGASSEDYCLKDVGSVFRRDIVSLIGGISTADIPDAAYVVTARGYESRLVFMCPFGVPRLEKVLRSVLLEHDTVEQAVSNILRLRIGNSCKTADPMDTRPSCGVQWHDVGDLDLECPDEATIAQMAALGQRPSDTTEWKVWEQGASLFVDLRILSPSGGLPIGSDSAFDVLTFDVKAIS